MSFQSRRNFLKSTAACAVAAPFIVPSSVFGNDEKAVPSERITIGHIGLGTRGRQLFRPFMAVPGAQSVAVADCFKSRREGFAQLCNGTAYLDFREMLARDDIDCVVIATPDHWHLPVATLAANAKKSVYVEKPLGLTLEQNITFQKMFLESDLVFQYGTQQRSMAHCWQGCELVRQGAIGKIHTIEVDAPNGSAGGSTAEAPIPDDLGQDGYQMWIGPAPMVPYTVDRCKPNGTFWIYDQSIGYLGGWGAHPLDIMVWGSDADLSGPIVVQGTGTIPTEGLYNTVYNWDMKMKLGEVDMIFRPGGDRTRFIGDAGWIEIRRKEITASDPKILEKQIDREKASLKVSKNHCIDFIHAVKNKNETVTSLKDAVRSDNISHLCDIAVRTGQTVKWDPGAFAFIDPTPEQQKLYSRKVRGGW